jgi:hypothetical protein
VAVDPRNVSHLPLTVELEDLDMRREGHPGAPRGLALEEKLDFGIRVAHYAGALAVMRSSVVAE